LQQDTPPVVAHDIGEVFIVVADRGKALADAFFFAAKDIDDGKRQDALRGFLQGGVEDLFDLGPRDQGRHTGRREPDQREREAKPQPQPSLQAARPPHPRPKR